MQTNQDIQYGSTSVIAQNRVLRNTYMLLGLSLLVSAAMALVSMRYQLPRLNIFLTLGIYFGLLFAISKFKNENFSILLVFALTGFLGFTIGPMLSFYLKMPNGGELVTSAFTTTAVSFLGLSAISIKSKKDFTFMGRFLFIGILAAFCTGLLGYFFDMPAVMLVVSGAFVLLMAGLILFETSRIVNGGETNYVMATVTLFVAIFNLFTSLLHIFGVMGDD